ncbi:MAG: hypothetical protein WAW87_06990 [Candidatus Ferrigenium altingense]|nr:MAG: hypothetical protein C4583_04820 [Anaerolineaceae bacterium]
MERVILVLAMLAGLHVVLSFLRFAVESLKSVLIRSQEKTATPEAVNVVEPAEVVEMLKEKSTYWQLYDTPTYMRRNWIDIDSGKNGDASFEVIA